MTHNSQRTNKVRKICAKSNKKSPAHEIINQKWVKPKNNVQELQ